MSDHMNMLFWPGLKQAAQRIADRDHGRNLRAYINTLVQRDVNRDARRSKKEKA